MVLRTFAWMERSIACSLLGKSVDIRMENRLSVIAVWLWTANWLHMLDALFGSMRKLVCSQPATKWEYSWNSWGSVHWVVCVRRVSISYGYGVLWLINGAKKNGRLRQLMMQLLSSLQSLTRGQGQCSRKFLTFIVYMATLVRVNIFSLLFSK